MDHFAPRRIVVIGSPGAGKTTLATRLGAVLGLPVIHLDRFLWRSGWVMAAPSAFDEALSAAMTEPAWIIEGNHMRSLPDRLASADLVVWLDLDRFTCLWRVVWRGVVNHGRTRPDLTPGCPERIDIEFLSYIWSFPSTHRPRILAMLGDRETQTSVVRLASSPEVRRFMSSFN